MDEALVLGFDFGLRRIGVAVGQRLTASASPTAVLACSAGEPDWPAIDALLREWRPGRLVVGRPANMDGTDSAMTAAAEAFAAQLHARSGLPVSLVDERLTSFEAKQGLRTARREGTRRRRVRPGDVDAEAARLIVETWLATRGEDVE